MSNVLCLTLVLTVPWVDQNAVVDVLEEALLHLHHGPRVHVPQHHAEEDEHGVCAQKHRVLRGDRIEDGAVATDHEREHLRNNL